MSHCNERSKPLTPSLSLWEREPAGVRGATVVPSVADLTFLPPLPRVIRRNVKSKTTLESNSC